MKLSHNLQSFEEAFKRCENIVVRSRVVCDKYSPISLAMNIFDGNDKYGFLLESVKMDERNHVSVIGIRPDLIWKMHGNTAYIARNNNIFNRVIRDSKIEEPQFMHCEADGIESLRNILADSIITQWPDGMSSKSMGLYGYLGYETSAPGSHKMTFNNHDTIGTPDAFMLRPSMVLLVDSFRSTVEFCVPLWSYQYQYFSSALEAYNNIEKYIEFFTKKAITGESPDEGYYSSHSGRASYLNDDINCKVTEPSEQIEIESNMTRAEYDSMLISARKYLEMGDIFQVVLSQRWKARLGMHPLTFYRLLRTSDSTPYMFYFDFMDFHVVGASPELMLHVEDSKIKLRPLAGTRRRGCNYEEDLQLMEELLNDEKELAEHLMLVDLGRNDVGRISKPGTVHVDKAFSVEFCKHVMHIVSVVHGELRNDCDIVTALISCLPAGTLSGAPKIRAMEIIDELEPEKRGVYGGAIAHFSSRDKYLDSCIAIRTAVIKDGVLYVQAGGGIVYDSDIGSEYEETLNKSKTIREVLGGVKI